VPTIIRQCTWWWASGVYHRTRERATRWLSPPYIAASDISDNVQAPAVSSLSPCGRGLGRGVHTGSPDAATPLPGPPPQGGGNRSCGVSPLHSDSIFKQPISDTRPHSRGAIAPELCKTMTLDNRGRRECRMRSSHPQPRVQVKKAHERSHHRYTAINRHSLRDGFNGLFRALPGDRAFLPPSFPQELLPKELNASVGAPGPHGFAVRRERASSLRAVSVHRIPPRVRDDREPPLCETG
jgi:hypothetical protein